MLEPAPVLAEQPSTIVTGGRCARPVVMDFGCPNYSGCSDSEWNEFNGYADHYAESAVTRSVVSSSANGINQLRLEIIGRLESWSNENHATGSSVKDFNM